MRGQKQTLIIENRFIVFPLRSILVHFCMCLKQLSKHFCHSDWGIFKTCILNSLTASSGVEKRWPLILFFTYGNKNKADDSSKPCFECSKMQLFEPMCESLHYRREEWSVFGGWLCTSQSLHFCVVLVVRLRHVQFFRKNWYHLLGNARCTSNFCWIWLILKHPYSRVLFTFGLIRVNL